MRNRWIVISLLSACSKQDTPAPPPVPAPAVAPRPPVAQTVPPPPVKREVVPCPKDLADQAAALFGTTAKNIDQPTCLAFWSENAAEWLFAARLMGDEGASVVVGTRTAGVAKVQWRAEDQPDGVMVEYQAEDLDGDGNDEVIEHEKSASGEGQLFETLNVYTVTQGALTRRASLPFSYTSMGPSVELGIKDGPAECRASLSFVPDGAGKLLRIKAEPRKGKPRADGCPKTATYAFDGKALVEKVAAR